MKRLFLDDIRRGLGKAYIELANAKDKTEYLDTLIFACTHDCSYDFIFEGPKSVYLYQMIKLFDSNIQNRIMNIIINSLNINDKHSLVFQKLDLLMCYKDKNQTIIKKALNDFYEKIINETKKWTKKKLASFEIIAMIMDRTFGKKKTKEILKFIEDKKLDKDSFGWYFYRLARRYRKDEYINELIKEPEIGNMNKDYKLDELLNTDDDLFINSFALKIDEDEFNNVLNYLSENQNLSSIKRILSAYSQTYESFLHIKYKLPQDLCFNLLKKIGDSIEEDVYDVLKYYKSNEVLKLGLKLLENKDFLYYGIVMMFTNYSKEYKDLIIDAYRKIDFSFDKYNDITGDTIWFMDHKRKNYPDEILLINYYNSYDSFMREYIYDVMCQRKLLTTKIIEECKYDFDYELSAKAFKNKKVFYKEIIDNIYSIEAKKYLLDNIDSINNLQWASLVLEFVKKDRIYFFMNLKEKARFDYEKELFNLAINDLNKYGYISEETEKYYTLNDPRGNNKPKFAFEEKIDFPIIYNFGDIVTYEDNIYEYYIVGIKPNITSESSLNDYDYLCYLVNNPINSNDDLFSAHEHLFACQMNKVNIKSLPKDVKKNIDVAIKVLKNNDLFKSIFKNMKEAFINNVNVLVTNGFEPEITLIDVLGNKYEIIAYSNFIDFYDSDNKYLKLKKIEDIFYYTKDYIIQYLDEFGNDLSTDLNESYDIDMTE